MTHNLDVLGDVNIILNDVHVVIKDAIINDVIVNVNVQKNVAVSNPYLN